MTSMERDGASFAEVRDALIHEARRIQREFRHTADEQQRTILWEQYSEVDRRIQRLQRDRYAGSAV